MRACWLWSLLHRQYSSPDFNGQLASVSYSPYTRSQHPDNGDRPTAEQIRADLRLLSSYARTIRTYSSTGGVELVPGIAAEFGLKVTIGIWHRQERGAQRARDPSAIALARRYSNVNAIVVGNEGHRCAPRQTVDELIQIIQRVKRMSPVPVTTGETWDVWLGATRSGEAGQEGRGRIKLASAVDFIAAHILPYWEGTPLNQAVDHTIQIYDKLRRAYPGKRIVIAEFGWPSAGYNYQRAIPGRIEQALVIRDFLARAEAYGIDYNIIEAIDQPWKTNRRRRRRLLGPVRRRAQREVQLDRAGQRSRSLEGRRPRVAARAAVLADDPGEAACDRRRSDHARRRDQHGRRLVRRSCSRSGTDTTSCPARRSRSGSASCC